MSDNDNLSSDNGNSGCVLLVLVVILLTLWAMSAKLTPVTAPEKATSVGEKP